MNDALGSPAVEYTRARGSAWGENRMRFAALRDDSGNDTFVGLLGCAVVGVLLLCALTSCGSILTSCSSEPEPEPTAEEMMRNLWDYDGGD